MAAIYDYIIAGGGTAGCVLASRLSSYKPESSILLVEAGPKDDSRIRPSLGLVGQAANEIKWKIQSAPQDAMNGKTLDLVQGKALGGTSAINHQVWIRGAAEDYDQWAEEVGDQRWSWDGMLPHFKECETFIPGPELEGKDLSSYRGFSGPITVSQTSSSGRPRRYSLREAIGNMYESQGVSRVADINSGHHLGYAEHSTSSYDGVRYWAGSNYTMGPNVSIMAETQVTKVVFEGSHAKGIECLSSAGERTHISAKVEVIVSSGSLGSPKLLLLSGVGPTEELSKHGITQVADLPVGQNYSDHAMLATFWHLEKSGLAMGDVEMRNETCDWTCGLPIDWLAFHRHDQDHTIRALAASDLSPVEWERFKLPGRAHTESGILYGHIDFTGKAGPPPAGSNITVMTKIVTPSSRGSITLTSAKPSDPPVCNPNMLSTELDRKLLFAAVRLTAEGLEKSIAPEYGLQENNVEDSLKGDYSDRAMKQRALNCARTVNHGCGTCAMGSVVDSECRVKGVTGLRVVDTSIIPLPLSAHYQAPVYAVAEQAARMIANI
ncbi:hypothetical protein N7456_011203 [Penicillium angulare]|uniref:Glucose-methanol-choline oxidoreductase N-terminal domain-containing protein n=1 Tax=Penicillium angulare TaxID=116970 RepID=A0A9W9K0H2_9EURO|nr:hypothetical protein N7456_011203 [Penicillium angulare]